MGYYGASAYRGDYYRGDYYGQRHRARGDFMSWLGGVAGNVVSDIFGAPKPALPAMTTPLQTMLVPGNPSQPLVSLGGNVPGKSLSLFTTTTKGGKVKSVHARSGHRRINPLNIRALSRALRRADGFKRIAKKVLRLTGEKKHVSGFKFHRKKKRA